VRTLASQGLSVTPRRIGLRHTLLTHLTLIDIAVEELKPRYMTGYGDVAADAATALNGIVEELRSTIAQLTRSLADCQTELESP
jgi:hypothetical protein